MTDEAKRSDDPAAREARLAGLAKARDARSRKAAERRAARDRDALLDRPTGERAVNVANFERVDDDAAPLRQRFETVVSESRVSTASAVDWLGARYPHRVTDAMRAAGEMFALFTDRVRAFGPRGMDIGKMKVDGGGGNAPEPLLGYADALREGRALVALLGVERVVLLSRACGDGKGVPALAREYGAENGIPTRDAQAHLIESLICALRKLADRWQVPEREDRHVLRAAMDAEALQAFLHAAGQWEGKPPVVQRRRLGELTAQEFARMSESDQEAWRKRFGREPRDG
jgi:hypothetical protein